MTPEDENTYTPAATSGNGMDFPVDEEPPKKTATAAPVSEVAQPAPAKKSFKEKLSKGAATLGRGAGKVAGKVATAVEKKHAKNEIRRQAERDAKELKINTVAIAYEKKGMSHAEAVAAANEQIAAEGAAIKAAKRAKNDALIRSVSGGSGGGGGNTGTSNALRLIGGGGGSGNQGMSGAMRLIGGGSSGNSGPSDAMRLIGGGGGNGRSPIDTMRMISGGGGGSGKNGAQDAISKMQAITGGGRSSTKTPAKQRKKGKGGSGGLSNTYGGVKLF